MSHGLGSPVQLAPERGLIKIEDLGQIVCFGDKTPPEDFKLVNFPIGSVCGLQEKIAHIAQGKLHVYSILAIASLLIYLGEEIFSRQPVDGLGYDFSPENTVVDEERIAPHEVIRKGGAREKADAIHPKSGT